MRRPPKYQIFVSSTFADLRHEREMVTWKLLKDHHIPAGMETFPASDDRGWETIARSIDDSDYYILILGWRYGSIDETTGVSWTHREYRYARDQGIPVLAFLRDEQATTLDKVERGTDATDKIRAFRAEIAGKHLYKTWRESADLCNSVGEALWQRIRRDEHDGTPRPGWYRGDLVASPETVDEMARLSRENHELKAQLATIASQIQKAELSLVGWPTEVQLVRHPAQPWPGNVSILLSPRSSHGFSFDQVKRWLDGRCFSAWLPLTLVNSGDALTEEIIVDFTIPRCRKIILEQVSRLSVSDVPRPPTLTRALDETRSVFVQKMAAREDGCAVRQRVRSVHGRSSEDLVPFGVVLDDEAEWAAHDEITVHFAIRDRLGTSVDGSVTIPAQVQVGPTLSKSSASTFYVTARR